MMMMLSQLLASHKENQPPPQAPKASLWLNVNLAITGVLLLFLGLFYLGQTLFNELMMIVGAYNFTFILLYWVIFVNDVLNRGATWLREHTRLKPPHIPRAFSVIIAYLAVIVSITVFAFAVYPALSEQLTGLRAFIPKALASLEHMAMNLQQTFHVHVPGLLVQQIATVKRSVLGALVNLGTQSITPFLYILMGQLISLYLLFDGNKLTRFIALLLPESRHNRLSRGVVLSQVLMYRTVKAYTVSAMLSSLILYATLKLMMIPYAGLFTLFFGLCCFIPVLGQWVGLILPVIYLLAKLQLGKLLLLAVVIGLYNFFRGKYVMPALFDRRYRLHPLIILVVMQLCLDFAGLWGILLLIPATVLIVTTKRLFMTKNPIKRANIRT